MDYDDNDFQGQNLQLAGEGNNKFSPVLRPYALPKFDFDDSLQGHLRFDSLVETEVFLGIQSQDNQWIEDFSRGNSGIEFSSSAAESCSISRRNNVWSEATSSESVEMLLKSVGQEEMIPGEALIEESDPCDELGSLANQMEPSLIGGDNNLPEGAAVTDSAPIVPESLESFSGLNNDASGSAYRRSGDLDSHDGSLTDKTMEDPHVSETKHDNIMETTENVITSDVVLINQETPDQANNIINDENASVLQNDSVPQGENHDVPSKDQVDPTIEENEVETRLKDVKEPSSPTRMGSNQVREAVVSEDIEIDDQYKGNIHSSPPVINNETPIEPNMDSPSSLTLGSNQVGEVVVSEDIEIDDQYKGNIHSSPSAINNETPIELNILPESVTYKQTNSGHGALGDGAEGSNVVDHPQSSFLSESMEICEPNLFVDYSDVHRIDQDGKRNAEFLPTDLVATEGEILENRVGSSYLSEDASDRDAIHESQSDVTPGNTQASTIALEVNNLASQDTVVGVPLPSGNDITSAGVVDHLDNEVTASDVSPIESSPNPLDGVSQVRNEPSHDTSGLQRQATIDQSLPMAVSSNPEKEVACGASDELSKEVEISVKEADGSGAVHQIEEATGKDNCEVAFLKVAGNALNEDGHALRPVPVSEPAAKLPSVEGGSSDALSEKMNCGSPTVISSIEISQSATEIQERLKGSVYHDISVVDIDAISKKVQSAINNSIVSDVSNTDKSFTFEVNSLPATSEKEAIQGWKPFSSPQDSKKSSIVEGTPSTPGFSQPKVGPEVPQESSRASDVEIVRGSGKGTPERKSRRASGKAAGKETAKKADNHKETTPLKPSEKGDELGNAPPNPTMTGPFVRAEEVQSSGYLERSSTKPTAAATVQSSNLPDLNTSVSQASQPMAFQQPFTDLQQVQLRAQIFVYGSLIQGAAPEEACMISAFGTSDGGRSIWENTWRVSVERLQRQPFHPATPETPLLSRSGGKTPDQTIKQGSVQSKVSSSAVCRPGGKNLTPPPVINSMIPLSSPLWSISTPSCTGLPTSGMPRGQLMDYHQALSPLHPYQSPSLRNFVGNNTSWLSQSPFSTPWIASPQASTIDPSARFSPLPTMEATAQPTPARESSLPHTSGIKHSSPSPKVHSGVIPEVKEAALSSVQPYLNPKSRKRKKLAPTPRADVSTQIQPEPISSPAVTSLVSSSVAFTTPVAVASKIDTNKFVTAVSPIGDRIGEQTVMFSEEACSKVKESKVQAEEAAAFAAAAVSQCEAMWRQLDIKKNSGLVLENEAKLASAAVAIAAAASVAKAAAAAAKVASDAAFQAKLMADEVLVLGGAGSSLSDCSATPASILKGDGRSNFSSSFLGTAREASRRRVEAASAATKRAENLDAVVKAAELAAEAVSQAGKIVTMGDPLSLSELVEAGPEGYWKSPQRSSEPVVKLDNTSEGQPKVDSVEEGPSGKRVRGGLSSRKERQSSTPGRPSTPRERANEAIEDHMRILDGNSDSVATIQKEWRGQKGRKFSDLSKTIGVVPGSEIGSRAASASAAVQNEYDKAVGTMKENKIKEGSLVEVFKDGSDYKAAWYSANVLSLKDGKALVCYTEVPSDEGSGQLKEWVSLEVKEGEAPKIRNARPITAMRFEGTRKRRREAMADNAWSPGNRVDAWIGDSWWEGVITEESKKEDDTAYTVHFPAHGETSTVKAWYLRPSLTWKDGEWLEWSSARQNKSSSLEGDMPQEKRLKLGSLVVEPKTKDNISKNMAVVLPGKSKESRLLGLSTNETVFDAGNRSDTVRATRTGQQKEGSRVVFGVPKPGKKRKFMEVSKHYVADRLNKASEVNKTAKFSKYLMPQSSGSSRAWKSSTRADPKEKRAVEPKPKLPKPLKLSRPRKENSSSSVSASHDSIVGGTETTKDTASHSHATSGRHGHAESGSAATTDGGGFVFSSAPLASDSTASKKMSTPNARLERANRGRLAPAAGKLAKIEENDKANTSNLTRSTPDTSEPRRSNRKIQPTSRLLEGLQSSLIISKMPSASHDKGHKSQSKGASASKGINRG